MFAAERQLKRLEKVAKRNAKACAESAEKDVYFKAEDQITKLLSLISDLMSDISFYVGEEEIDGK